MSNSCEWRTIFPGGFEPGCKRNVVDDVIFESKSYLDAKYCMFCGKPLVISDLLPDELQEERGKKRWDD